VRSPILAAFREKKKLGKSGSGWEWQRKELEDLFSYAVIRAAKSRTITLFVDALDEAGAGTANELAIYFHELNNKLAVRMRTAKFCISCRHYPIPASNTSLNVHVEDENYDDIAKYVKERLDTELPGPPEMASLSIQECQALKKTIVRRASGIFMWARLIIQLIIGFIRDGESLTFINDEIYKVPPHLGDIYDHILKTVIPTRSRTRTLLLMQWICLAERPLSVTELRYAIASDDIQIHQARQFCKDAGNFVDTDARMQIQLTSLSGGLVEAKRHGAETTVQFIHQSANDFVRSQGLKYLTSAAIDLQSQPPRDLSADIVIGQSHNRLCKSCVNYLRLDEVLREATLIIASTAKGELDRPEQRLMFLSEKLPFILYATKSWFLHAEKAEGLGILQQDLVQQLGFSPGPAFQTWIKIFHGIDKYNAKLPVMGSTLLHIASGSNLRSAVQVLLNDNGNVDTRDDAGNTALHYAARWGHTDLVKMLLDARADIGAKNKVQSTALERAAVNGHEETLQLLLRQGADVNDCTGRSGNALQAAAREGKYIVVQLLLNNSAGVNTQGGQFRNALQAASWEGHYQIVELLLSKGANINIQGGHYGSALQAASQRGHNQIVELLLSKDANVNAQGGYFGNALQAASQRGYNQIVELLLSKGAI
jgi:ankyrin repeat protein